MPLNVIRVSRRIEEVLRLCDGISSVHDVAKHLHGLSEEEVFGICRYFSKRGVLETVQARADGHSPSITVIIPVKDRAAELAECLESIFSQDYPADSIDVIVVDDASQDETAAVAGDFSCRLISLSENRGQSHCRNLGAREAGGEIVAFIDSDCVAGKGWLRETAPYFRWDKVGAVGGRVDGYFETSRLDRYEKAFSSLSMGSHILHGGPDDSLVYAPMCNLLVRRSAFLETGGIRGEMRVGEDVDFCWRMRTKGHVLLYVPFGAVLHKHRSRLAPMLKRRWEYGTSEASLYRLHPHKRKLFPSSPVSAMAFVGLCGATVFTSIVPLGLTLYCFLFGGASKAIRTRKHGVAIALWKACFSVIRTQLSFFYFASFHLVRYYLIPLVLLGFAYHPLWLLSILFIGLSSVVDYSARRPRLAFPIFLFYYTLEHLFYQAGVFAGCLRAKTFGSYRPRIVPKRGL
jgi:mycofactocin system glycosyltransferase